MVGMSKLIEYKILECQICEQPKEHHTESMKKSCMAQFKKTNAKYPVTALFCYNVTTPSNIPKKNQD